MQLSIRRGTTILLPIEYATRGESLFNKISSMLLRKLQGRWRVHLRRFSRRLP